MERREKYLMGLLEKHNIDEDGSLKPNHRTYHEAFEIQARYLGEGVYQWCGAMATDTRILFLKGILNMNEIPYNQE